jgi:hypothetical protein
MMFKIITFFIITLFVGLNVRVGILFIRVCSDIIFSDDWDDSTSFMGFLLQKD